MTVAILTLLVTAVVGGFQIWAILHPSEVVAEPTSAAEPTSVGELETAEEYDIAEESGSAQGSAAVSWEDLTPQVSQCLAVAEWDESVGVKAVVPTSCSAADATFEVVKTGVKYQMEACASSREYRGASWQYSQVADTYYCTRLIAQVGMCFPALVQPDGSGHYGFFGVVMPCTASTWPDYLESELAKQDEIIQPEAADWDKTMMRITDVYGGASSHCGSGETSWGRSGEWICSTSAGTLR